MSAENKINQIYIIRNSSEIRNINVKINIPSNFTYNKKKKKYSKLSSFNASESPSWSHFPSTGRTVAIFPRDVNKLQLPLPSSSRYLPLIYFRVRTAVHPQLNGNQDVPVISRVSIQPEVREIFLSLSPSLSSGNVAESLLCSSKRGRRWPWANKSNGPAGQNRFPFRKLKLAAVQIAHALQK